MSQFWGRFDRARVLVPLARFRQDAETRHRSAFYFKLFEISSDWIRVVKVSDRIYEPGLNHARISSGASLLIILLISLLGAASRANDAPRRVLLLHSFSHAVSTWDDTAASFREELIKRSPEALDLHDIAYDAVRYQDPQEEGPFVEYLRSLFSGRKVDLVVPIGAPAAYFIQRHRLQLFPSAPMLVSAVEQRRMNASTLGADDTTINATVDLSSYIRNILRVLPNTKNIAVVIGNSPVERYWLSETQRVSKAFAGRVNFTWLNDLSFDEMLKRAAALTRQSAILYFVFAEDVKGISYSQDRALDALRNTVKVPIFGVGDSQLGRGIVGGPLLQSRTLGRRTAEVALRILKGERARDIKSPPVGLGAPIYDWRELRRWGISEAMLPPGSVVQFREPTVWEQYRWSIILTATALFTQTLIIGYGFIQDRRRKQAEISLKESEDRMTFAAISANVGLWQFDRTTNELWATEHSRTMFGLAKDFPFTRERFLAAVHPEDRLVAMNALREVMKGRPAVPDVRIVLPDGQPRWIRVRLRSRLDDHGSAGKLSGIFVDITERKTAEYEAELQRQEVAHLMRVSVVGELSGAIAHEVNQPLTAILSNAQAALYLLAQDSPNLTEVRDALQDIVQEDNRAGEVVHRLRKLLKKGETRFEPVDVNELVNSTIALLRNELIGRRVTVVTDLAIDLPAVIGDSVQLQQVLLNLIINAMDAMDFDTCKATACQDQYPCHRDWNHRGSGKRSRAGNPTRRRRAVRTVLYHEGSWPRSRPDDLFDHRTQTRRNDHFTE